MLSLFTMLGASFTLVILLMLAIWVVYLFQKNPKLIDVGWGVGFIIAAWIYLIIGEGDFFKKLILALMVTIWAGRLSWHLFERYKKSSLKDGRFELLLQIWGEQHSPNALFFLLSIVQGVLIIILSLPFLIVGIGSDDRWGGWEAWGIALWAIGTAGETLADMQLARFHADPANQSKVCKQGLWRLSRHPNYFFDFVVWVGFALFAIPAAWGWLAVISPLLMLFIFMKLTGIPLTEAESLRTKGDEYREYQKTTSPFFPWFPG